MCKLNIYCNQEDGSCNCHKEQNFFMSKDKPHNNLLCSILSYISTQPEVMKAISDGQIDLSAVEPLSSTLDPSPSFSPSTEVATMQISLLNDLSPKLFVGRSFSLMLEIVDNKGNRVSFEEPIRMQVALVNSSNRSDRLVLGEIETNAVGLFKKLTITEKVNNCCLVARVPSRPDVSWFSANVKVLVKKNKQGKEETKIEA